MDCRNNCGACCIAPSISSPIPDMPAGKMANIPCIQLDKNFECKIFNSPNRPQVCRSLRPSKTMCRNSREEALAYLSELEKVTSSH